MDRNNKERVDNENAQIIGGQIAANFAKDVQEGTRQAVSGMKLFEAEIERLQNVDFDQKKGNLFEYIEAAKFNREAANRGVDHRAIVTAADGRPHDPADIEIVDGSKKVIRRVQAKFIKTTAANGKDSSAATTVNKLTDPKYKDMQLLGRKDTNYKIDPETGKSISMLDEEKKIAKAYAKPGNLKEEAYRDFEKNATDELTDETTGIKTGGTTLEEMQNAVDEPAKYAQEFRMKQYGKEVAVTAKSAAVASMVTTGIISGVNKAVDVMKGEKDLKEAAKELGKDIGKSGAKGAATGALAAGIRIAGENAGGVVQKFTDSSSAMVIAGSVIDCGVGVYDLIRGEINAKQFAERIEDTTIKAAVTVYFSKVAVAVFGASNPIVTIAVYSVANYVIASTREIIKNANLNAEEAERAVAINNEMAKLIRDYREYIVSQINEYQANYRVSMSNLLESFDRGIASEDDLDSAVYAIIDYAEETGLALQHTDFDDFSDAMMSDKPFSL